MASPELIKENGVGILYLNSPSKRNSLTVQDMLLIRLLLEDQDHSDIAALIITGKGKVFCAGADFAEIVSITRKNSKEINLCQMICQTSATQYKIFLFLLSALSMEMHMGEG